MINEKFFLSIWILFLALAFVDIVNFGIWLTRVLYLRGADNFILSQLVIPIPQHLISIIFQQISAIRQIPSEDSISLFIRRGLCRDGMVVLWLISINCDPTVTSFLVKFLYCRFYHCLFRSFNSEI